MNKTMLVFVWAIFFQVVLNAQYETSIKAALVNLEFHEEEICHSANLFKQNPRDVIAVVFPEMIRYNLVKDFFETTSLKLIYVNLGSREVDFSIGIFQMKPSFIEKLEEIIFQNQTVFPAYQFISQYKSKDPSSIRAERIKRMENNQWQVLYAFAFFAVADACFWAEEFCSPEERIAFYAAAYNLGFDAKISDIRNWVKVKAFPYGRKYNGVQMSYSDLAIDFYKKYHSAIQCPKVSNSSH